MITTEEISRDCIQSHSVTVEKGKSRLRTYRQGLISLRLLMLHFNMNEPSCSTLDIDLTTNKMLVIQTVFFVILLI